MRITAPMGTEEYEQQMEQLAEATGGMPPLAMANIAAPMPQHQQAAAPIIQQQPGVMNQAKDMMVDKAVDKGIQSALGMSAGKALGSVGTAFGPMGMIAGQVAGEFLPQLLKRGLRFNDGGHVGPLGAKYYSTGTPNLFGDAYADPGKAASLSSSADRANLSAAVNELSKVDRPSGVALTGKDQEGGIGGLLGGLFSSPVFAPLSNLVSGVSQWAGEAFPDAGSSAAAKAISAEANKGKSPIGADSWTWNIGNRNFTTMTPAAAHKAGKTADWQYVETLKNTGGSPYKGFKGALNAALPGAQGATPVYNKKTNKTSWFHNPTPQQLHPHLKEKGHAYSDGGKVGPLGAQYLAEGSRPYSGVFKKPVSPTRPNMPSHLGMPKGTKSMMGYISPEAFAEEKIKTPLQVKAPVVKPNARIMSNVMPKFLGPLGTIAGIVNPTMAAVATKDPVNAPPMGQEAEMFRRQAAIDAAKPSIWERYKSGDIPYTIPSIVKGFKTEIPPSEGVTEALQESFKHSVDPYAYWNPIENPRQGYESGQDKRQMYSSPMVYET